MSQRATSVQSGRRISPLLQFRFWQFGLLVALTAIAIVDIQGYCRKEPRLIALASAGYAGYALLCWLLWHAIRRFESRLGSVLVVAVYTVAMGGAIPGGHLRVSVDGVLLSRREVVLSKHRQEISGFLHGFVLALRPGANVRDPVQLAAIVGEVLPDRVDQPARRGLPEM